MEKIINLNQRKRSQLHQSASIPMYLTIEEYKYDENLGTFLYKIEYGIQINQTQVSQKIIYKRYSEILNFYNELSSINKNTYMDNFPGKIWFFKNDKDKIKQRYEQMNTCLSQICHIKDITNNKIFKKFVNEK